MEKPVLIQNAQKAVCRLRGGKTAVVFQPGNKPRGFCRKGTFGCRDRDQRVVERFFRRGAGTDGLYFLQRKSAEAGKQILGEGKIPIGIIHYAEQIEQVDEQRGMRNRIAADVGNRNVTRVKFLLKKVQRLFASCQNGDVARLDFGAVVLFSFAQKPLDFAGDPAHFLFSNLFAVRFGFFFFLRLFKNADADRGGRQNNVFLGFGILQIVLRQVSHALG